MGHGRSKINKSRAKAPTLGGGGVPELKGTEKQIAWAKDIRKNYIDKINKVTKWFDDVKKTGSYSKTPIHEDARELADVFRSYGRYDIEGSEIDKKYFGAKTREERKALRPKHDAKIADAGKKEIIKRANRILKHDEAKYFINNRRNLETFTIYDTE